MAKSTPHLFAIAHGADCVGEHVCFYCGAPCGDKNHTSDYVRDTFTAVDSVRFPGSQFVCDGCVLCLQESVDVPMCDGTTKTVTKAARRMFTWLVRSDGVVAASKAHLAWIRGVCLSPPSPPWSLSIAVSGQKQLLYLGVVNHDVNYNVVTLEGRRIGYSASELQDAIAKATLIAGVCGRPAMESQPTYSHRFQLFDAMGDDGIQLAEWWSVSIASPIFALASYLCPSKKEQTENG